MDVPALDGLRVLDLTRAFPGGYCTLLLAQLGEEVIKVEAPRGGDPLRGGQSAPTPAHVGLNRGKRSITLDTRTPGAPAVLRRLVTNADVLVESARPGVMAAAGFGPDDGLAANPMLVWASVTGFGQDGPVPRRPGHEVTFLGQSGLLSALGGGQPWMPDAMVSVPVGGLAAALGIVGALLGRALHSRGTVVDAAIADASTWLLSGMPEVADASPISMGWTAGRRLYCCADGGFVTTAAAEPSTWRVLCEGLETPEFLERLGDDAQGQTEMAERFESLRRPAGRSVGRRARRRHRRPRCTRASVRSPATRRVRRAASSTSSAATSCRGLRSGSAQAPMPRPRRPRPWGPTRTRSCATLASATTRSPRCAPTARSDGIPT